MIILLTVTSHGETKDGAMPNVFTVFGNPNRNSGVNVQTFMGNSGHRGHPSQDMGTLGAKTEGKAGLKKKNFPLEGKTETHPAHHLGRSSPRSCMPPHLRGL